MSEPSVQQQRYWNELTQLRGHIEYLNLYELHCERIDRTIKIFLAIAASGSITAWAVWREFAMLWGSIIACSQLLAAIKEYLPFEKRLKCTRDLSGKFESVFIQWETVWNSLANGELSDEEINAKLADLKKQKVELTTSCLAGTTLPDKPRLRSLAVTQAVAYFEVIYQNGGTDEQKD